MSGCRSQFVAFLLLLALLTAGYAAPQSGKPASFPPIDEASAPAALVRSVQMVPGPEGAAVEIITTRPLVPVINLLDGPARLVIDLPKSVIPARRRIAFRSAQVRDVRVDQYEKDPPTVRIVVDLVKSCRYSWDAAGNRLMIRMYPPAADEPRAASAEPVAPTLVPVSRDRGTVLPQSRLAPGASVMAGADTTVLRLSRGGEVRVCPGTTVSVSSSQDGRDLMLGMSTGALETHYTLDASADSVITPDFRILMAGPGAFHYAISADSRGNTCVRALPGNAGSAIVSELMGNGVYQVKPTEEVVFRGGTLKQIDTAVPQDCGCPESSVNVLRTASAPSPAAVAPPLDTGAEGAPLVAAQPEALPGQAEVAENGPETARLPASHPNDVHVEVDAPFVFRATDPQPPQPPTRAEIAALPPVSSGRSEPVEIMVLPPPQELPAIPAAQAHAGHPGFFGKIKHFFAGFFH